jgi:hypothetical protein
MLHGELGEREVGRGRAEGDVLDWIRIARGEGKIRVKVSQRGAGGHGRDVHLQRVSQSLVGEGRKETHISSTQSSPL